LKRPSRDFARSFHSWDYGLLVHFQ